LDIVFELAAKLADCVLDGPGGAVGQSTDSRARNNADVVANLQQQIQIAQATAARLDAVEHVQRPAGPFAAGSALAAAFVREESTAIVQEVDDGNRLVEHHDGRRPQAQAARA